MTQPINSMTDQEFQDFMDQTRFNSMDDVWDLTGNSIVHLAALENAAALHYIDTKRPDLLSLKSKDGWTTVHYAIWGQNIDSLQYLAETHPNLFSEKNNIGEDAAHMLKFNYEHANAMYESSIQLGIIAKTAPKTLTTPGGEKGNVVVDDLLNMLDLVKDDTQKSNINNSVISNRLTICAITNIVASIGLAAPDKLFQQDKNGNTPIVNWLQKIEGKAKNRRAYSHNRDYIENVRSVIDAFLYTDYNKSMAQVDDALKSGVLSHQSGYFFFEQAENYLSNTLARQQVKSDTLDGMGGK